MLRSRRARAVLHRPLGSVATHATEQHAVRVATRKFFAPWLERAFRSSSPGSLGGVVFGRARGRGGIPTSGGTRLSVDVLVSLPKGSKAQVDDVSLRG